MDQSRLEVLAEELKTKEAEILATHKGFLDEVAAIGIERQIVRQVQRLLEEIVGGLQHGTLERGSDLHRALIARLEYLNGQLDTRDDSRDAP